MSERRPGFEAPRAALARAAAYGAMLVVLSGCGQSGPLELPGKSSLAARSSAGAAPIGIHADSPGVREPGAWAEPRAGG